MAADCALRLHLGPWSEHGTAWYSCNRFDEKESVDARDAQSKSRASLERYLHVSCRGLLVFGFHNSPILQYYNRWANHEQSAKLSMDLYAKTEKKMEEMQLTSALTWIEVQFMKKAVDEVFKCRMTLKWTYAMGYYLQKGNEKELFEDNQRFGDPLALQTSAQGLIIAPETSRRRSRTYPSCSSSRLIRRRLVPCVRR